MLAGLSACGDERLRPGNIRHGGRLLHADDLPERRRRDLPLDLPGYRLHGEHPARIPGVANVSVGDPAASDYMYGPMLPDQDTLGGASAMMESGKGSATIGEQTLTAVDAGDILHAGVGNAGKEGVKEALASGDSHASLYAESTGPPLSEDTVATVLHVLASITP